MTGLHTIIAGRSKRRVQVEQRRRRVREEEIRRRIAANDAAVAERDRVHEIGVAAVAHALGLGHMLDMGGAMTAERGRALDGRKGVRSGFGASGRKSGKNTSTINVLESDLGPETVERKSGDCASGAVEKRDMGCARPGATKPEIRVDLSTGALAADIGRHIHPTRGVFGSALWLGGTL